MKAQWIVMVVIVLASVPAAATAQAKGDELQSVREVSAAELLPLSPRERRFRVTSGSGEGQLVPLTLQQVEEDGTTYWQLEFEGFNTLRLNERADGGVVIDRLEVSTERETVFYDPPVVLLPATIVPDRHWTGTGTVQVWDWDEERIEHTGTYEHRVLPISRQRFYTPAGEFAGFLLRIEQTVDLHAPASLHLGLDSGFVAGTGLVHRSMRLVVDKPAWFGDTTERTVELAE